MLVDRSRRAGLVVVAVVVGLSSLACSGHSRVRAAADASSPSVTETTSTSSTSSDSPSSAATTVADPSHSTATSDPSTTTTDAEVPSTESTDSAPTTTPVACPETSPIPPPPRHQRDGTDQTMVPGSPVRLVGCRYHGANQPQPPGTLAASAEVNAAEVARLANQVVLADPQGTYNCPEDFGERFLLQFSYSDGPDLMVIVERRGCRFVYNGDLFGSPPNDDLTNALQASLGADAAPN